MDQDLLIPSTVVFGQLYLGRIIDEKEMLLQTDGLTID